MHHTLTAAILLSACLAAPAMADGSGRADRSAVQPRFSGGDRPALPQFDPVVNLVRDLHADAARDALRPPVQHGLAERDADNEAFNRAIWSARSSSHNNAAWPGPLDGPLFELPAPDSGSDRTPSFGDRPGETWGRDGAGHSASNFGGRCAPGAVTQPKLVAVPLPGAALMGIAALGGGVLVARPGRRTA